MAQTYRTAFQRGEGILNDANTAKAVERSTDRTPVIQVRKVRCAYGDSQVLCDISIDVAPGEFVSIVGRSGCGKTTLLNCIAGFLPYSGTIRTLGKIGVCFQDNAVFPWMTVRQNIAFGVTGGRRQRDDVVAGLLARIGMESHADRYPAQLSGGQVQRVSLARALGARPDILLMDEPYGALDRDTRDRMQEWLLATLETNRPTIVFVTHDIEESIYLSDRVVLLEDGHIAQTFEVPFLRPRSEDAKYDPAFTELKRRTGALLKHD